MISTDLREIVGDLRFALSTRLRDLYPNSDGARGFSHTAEAGIAKDISGEDLSAFKGDYYITPGDGAGPIVIVVGKQEEEKGQVPAAKDGKPIRLLQIKSDRSVKLRHPRHTQFERDMLKVLEHFA